MSDRVTFLIALAALAVAVYAATRAGMIEARLTGAGFTPAPTPLQET